MTWGVRLEGHPFDLLDWADSLKPPFDPWVEVSERDGQERMFVLRTSAFNGLKSAEEVPPQAIPVVQRISGALAITGSTEPVRQGAVIEFAADGSIKTHHVVGIGAARMRMRGSAVGVTLTSDGKVVPPPPPTPSIAQAWNGLINPTKPSPEAVSRADVVAGLLSHASQCDNWYSIYKTMECAEHLAGGEHKLRQLMAIRGKAYKNARTTANAHRHAGTTSKLPKNPATLEQARDEAFAAARLVLNRELPP